jgi:hypothetical protein
MAGLSGMKAICGYCNRSEATILCWIRQIDFPAAKITGSWESDTVKIDEWRCFQIEKAQNGTKRTLKMRPVNRKNA